MSLGGQGASKQDRGGGPAGLGEPWGAGGVDKENRAVGEGKAGCFLRLQFLQAPWRPETRERPGKVSAGAEPLTEPVESRMLSLTQQGFEDLQET